MEIFTTNEKIGNEMNFIVLGDSHVGKTTLLQQYCNCKIANDALGNPPKTIGMNIHVKKILHDQSLLITKFYDFSGDPEYTQDLDIFLKLILNSKEDYLGGSPIHGIFLVFDVNLKRTLESLKKWLYWIQENLIKIGESQGKFSKVVCQDIRKKIKKIPVFVLGNKIDKLTQKVGLRMKELNQRNEVSSNFNKIIQRVTDFLRRKFAFVDFDNLLFLSRNMDNESTEALNELIFAAFDHFCPEAGVYSKIDVEAYTLDRFVGWDNGRSGNLSNFGFLGFFSKIFKKEDSVALPLYSN